jgi:hypothetical protein
MGAAQRAFFMDAAQRASFMGAAQRAVFHGRAAQRAHAFSNGPGVARRAREPQTQRAVG